MDPAARLLKLLSLLQRRVRWTGEQLASELGVTARTLRRDIDRLRSLGYPVDSAPGVDGGYQLGVGGELPPLLLDDDEAAAVAVALRAAAANAAPGLEEIALAALSKVERLLPRHVRARVGTLGMATDLLVPDPEAVSPASLVALASAIENCERVLLVYSDRDGNRTERRADPYRLVATNRRWYLLAFDVDRADWRTFRVDRVEVVRPTGHRFVPREQPDAARLVSEAITVAPYRFQATVRFDAPADVLRRRIPPTVGTITPEGPATCVLRTGGDHLPSLAAHLVALDLPFEVLAPAELRAHLRSLGRRLVRCHADRRNRTGATEPGTDSLPRAKDPSPVRRRRQF